ncbi:MAG: hypothetical protein D6819_06570 [Gammaproteobacteria bacterium]|nr:MAG: hypothetical protein D6819_06570 [Gammaproteobacteria bacterium]
MASVRNKLEELAEIVANETGKSLEDVTTADLIFKAVETKTIRSLLKWFDSYYPYPIEVKRASPSKFMSPFSEFNVGEIVDPVTIDDLDGTLTVFRNGEIQVQLTKNTIKRLLRRFLDGPIQTLVSRMGPGAQHLRDKPYSSWEDFIRDVVEEGLGEELKDAISGAKADITRQAGREISKAIQDGNFKALDKLVKKNIKVVKDELVRCEYQNLFEKPWYEKGYIC